MDKAEALLLQALGCAVRGEECTMTEKPEQETLRRLFRLARQQSVLPLVIQALASSLSEDPLFSVFQRKARSLTIHQAQRTGDFLLLMLQLQAMGLRPAVLKGAVCRSLYPEPEQRGSLDEDLLIPPEEFPRYQEALLACGLQRKDPDRLLKGEYEVTYLDPERDIYLELHLHPFSAEEDACGDCSRPFDDALSRIVPFRLYGQTFYTLAPTDHLLYLICHAYKHILFGGVGIRQICDICLFARQYEASLDWAGLRASCEDLGILTLASAFFRVGQRHLDIPCPSAFSEPEVDELPLLADCLSGGTFGVDDPDRLHSSRITLDAVAAGKQGRARRGIWSSIFPGKEHLQNSYPYARAHPWLLPVAWAQRLIRYAAREKGDPGKSLRIGRERVELLRKYKIIP